MNLTSKLYISLFLIPLLLFSSCGLNDDGPTDAHIYDLSNLEGSCDLNTKSLTNILSQDIVADINCLESSLNQFSDFVRRSNDQVIERHELDKFISKFFPESREIASDILRLVYNLNSLILRDPVDQMRVSKLPGFFNIIRAINGDGRHLYQMIKDLNQENYWSQRQTLFFHIESLARNILSTIDQYLLKEDLIYELDLEYLLSEIKEILNLSDDQLNLEKIRPWFFAKRLFLAGSTKMITSSEVIELLDRSSTLVITGLDAIYAFDKEYDNINDQYYLYYSIVEDIRSQIKIFPNHEVVIDENDFFTLLNSFLDEEDDEKNIQLAITKFKEKFIGGSIKEILYEDLDTLISWLEEFTGMLYFNAITYDHFNDKMRSPHPISGLQRPNQIFYHNLKTKYLDTYWEQFTYIAKNYRFFQDDNNKNHYYNYFKRFKTGIQSASMFRWIAYKAIEVYGHYPKGHRLKHIDKDDLGVAIYDLKGLVEFLGFWPDDPQRFLSEAIASSDLFMPHSDGNQMSSAEEVTEYINNVIHSFGVSSDVHKRLQKYCAIIDTDKESFEIPCFREHFIHILFNELKYQVYYNKLFDFLQEIGVNEFRNYLINIELYARINPDPKLPLTKEDLSRFLTILTNLETAFIRFDINKDGLLQIGELDMVFLVFRNLVKDVADLGKEDSSLYKSIFLYLIKYMKVPSAKDLIKFHLFAKKSNITSTRMNISAILSNFKPQ